MTAELNIYMKSKKFNSILCGKNIELSECGKSAKRLESYCHAIVLSEQLIEPGELFAVEIEELENGWNGNLRIGFSMLDDDKLNPLPSDSIPGLIDRGFSWICGVGQNNINLQSFGNFYHQYPNRTQISISDNYFYNRQSFKNESNVKIQSRSGVSCPPYCNCCVRTRYGTVPFGKLISSTKMSNSSYPLPFETGSVVAIFYEIIPINSIGTNFDNNNLSWNIDSLHFMQISPNYNDRFYSKGNGYRCLYKLRFHLLVNGFQQLVSEEIIGIQNHYGQLVEDSSSQSRFRSLTCSESLSPLNLRAIVDVYGMTKKVRIKSLKQEHVDSLESLCYQFILHTILIYIDRKVERSVIVYSLHLPPQLTESLYQHCVALCAK